MVRGLVLLLLTRDGNPAMNRHPMHGELLMPLVASCYRNLSAGERRPGDPYGSFSPGDWKQECTLFTFQ